MKTLALTVSLTTSFFLAYVLPVAVFLLVIGFVVSLRLGFEIWRIRKRKISAVRKRALLCRELTYHPAKMLLLQAIVVTLFMLDKKALNDFTHLFLSFDFAATKLAGIVICAFEGVKINAIFRSVRKKDLTGAIKQVAETYKEVKEETRGLFAILAIVAFG